MKPENKFVSLKTALLLRRAGFEQVKKSGEGTTPQNRIMCYWPIFKEDHPDFYSCLIKNFGLQETYSGQENFSLACPTFAQAIDFLREEKNIHLFISTAIFDEDDFITYCYFVGIFRKKGEIERYKNAHFEYPLRETVPVSKDYYETTEEGIQYICKEILKTGDIELPSKE